MKSQESLTAFRGDFPTANLNARRIAAALEVPGCHRRTVLEASVVNLEKLGVLATGDAVDRQSPYAIARGNQFETQVTDNGMASVLSLARKHLGLEIPEAREKDLSAASVRLEFPGIRRERVNNHRARLTRRYVKQMLTRPELGINLLRHGMTELNFGGELAYLEQDVLAFTVRGRIHVVEIKSYPMIDGRADPSKASATGRQAAVYVLSLQELAESLGAAPDVVDTKVMIVLPENLSFRPTAAVIDTQLQVRRLRRQLADVPRAAAIVDALPLGTALPPMPDISNAREAAAAQTSVREALAQLPPRFGDGCIRCPLFRFCRDEAEHQQTVARLGNVVAGDCGNITTVRAALDFAAGGRQPTNAGETAAAELLARAKTAIALTGRSS